MRSLKYKLFVPLLAIGISVAIGGTYAFDKILLKQLTEEGMERAESMVHAINYAAETISSRADLQRFVMAMGAEQDVEQIVIVGGEPARVIASTRHAWLDGSVTSLPDSVEMTMLDSTLGKGHGPGHVQVVGDKLHASIPLVLHNAALDAITRNRGAVSIHLNIASLQHRVRRDALWASMWMLGMVAVIAALVLGLLHRLVLVPVRDTSRAMERRAAGDGNAYAPVHADDELGALARVFNNMLDALHERELQFRSLVANMPGVIYRRKWQEQGRGQESWPLYFVSDHIEELTGYPQREFVDDNPRSYTSLIVAEDAPPVAAAKEQGIAKKHSFAVEYRLRHADGGIRWISERGHALFDTEDRPMFVDGFMLDVTESRLQGEALRQAKEAAEAAAHAKSEFLATMSHELRTPLNGVIGMASLLVHTALSEEQRDYVDTIQTSANILLAVINDILDLSKLEAGRIGLEKISFDMRAVIRECTNMLAERARSKDLDLSWTVADDVPLQLTGDPSRLRQVLLNLLGNAIKFTPRGSIFVNVTMVTMDEHDACVQVAIQDTGIGIAPDALAPIFEPFAQADASTTRVYGGTGLGLAICKRLVEQMDGTIWASSEMGVGSTFYFTIKLGVVARQHDGRHDSGHDGAHGHEATGEDAPEPLAASSETSPEATTPRRILVAEDNLINQKVIASMLRSLGYQADVVGNGHQAIEAVESKEYDLILMDCQMPELDGYEATLHLRRTRNTSIPIIGVTASALPGDRERCLDVGMNGYLSKPVVIEDLRQAIGSQLESDSAGPGEQRGGGSGLPEGAS